MSVVIFVCVANSARSQMAEGLARHSAPAGVSVYSAGSEPTSLNPLAVEALAERGIDIAHHAAKGFDDVPLDRADVVVTLCAEENCPVIPSTAKRLSWAMPDPAARGDLEAFRNTRDRIAERLPDLWREVNQNAMAK